MTTQIMELWDFNNPELSEGRFRAALKDASGDEALILLTQVARTYGLRGDFAVAQQILAAIEAQVQSAGVEAQVFYYLELGRSYASATHPPESQTDAVKEMARAAYLQAVELAQEAELDRLAIDALHMMAFVDTEPEEQVAWNRKAIAIMEASTQAEARKWEGALHNNQGYALHELGRFEDALQEFELALKAHARGGDPQKIRVAHWMIAWTLRSMGRLQEALAIQLRLERECEAAGEPDPYVFEELEHLYRALGDTQQADFYAARRKSSMGGG